MSMENKIILLIQKNPAYKQILENILEWYHEKTKCNECGVPMKQVSDLMFKCPKCGREKLIAGFEAYEVKATPAHLNKLYNEGILKITYKSRRYTNYMPVDIKAIENALKKWEQSTKETDYDKPIEIPPDIFEDIIGLDDIKNTIIKALKSKKPVHILLVGPPACAKSQLMEEIWQRIPGSYMVLAGTSTKAGIRDVIAEYTPRVLLIDELDKMSDPKELSVLLSWMENQRIIITMKDRREIVTCKYKDGCRVIAACNTDRHIPPELKSRFLRIVIRPYTEEEFIKITTHVLVKKEGKTKELAEYIARKLATELYTRDPRDAIKIARLAETKKDVDELIEMLKKRR